MPFSNSVLMWSCVNETFYGVVLEVTMDNGPATKEKDQIIGHFNR